MSILFSSLIMHIRLQLRKYTVRLDNKTKTTLKKLRNCSSNTRSSASSKLIVLVGYPVSGHPAWNKYYFNSLELKQSLETFKRPTTANEVNLIIWPCVYVWIWTQINAWLPKYNFCTDLEDNIVLGYSVQHRIILLKIINLLRSFLVALLGPLHMLQWPNKLTAV